MEQWRRGHLPTPRRPHRPHRPATRTRREHPALQRHYGILQSLALGEDPTLRAKEEDETLPDSQRFARGEGAIADFFARLPEMARARAAPRKRKWDGAKGRKA